MKFTSSSGALAPSSVVVLMSASVLVSFFVSTTSASSQHFESRNQIKKSTPFKACIDDSDCASMGHAFACFKVSTYI